MSFLNRWFGKKAADAPVQSGAFNPSVPAQHPAQATPPPPPAQAAPVLGPSAVAPPKPAAAAPPLPGASQVQLREYAVAFTFSYKGPEEAKKFFTVLKSSNSSFPYNAPYEVAHASGGGGDFVAVLVQLRHPKDESVAVKESLNEWFEASGAGEYDDDEWLTAPLPGRKRGSLADVLGSSYRILGKFGNLQIATQTGLDPVETEYARKCLEPQYREQREDRRWDSPGAKEVIALLNGGKNEECAAAAEARATENSDLDLFYDWGGSAYMKMKDYDRARRIFLQGLSKAKRKSLNCNMIFGAREKLPTHACQN